MEGLIVLTVLRDPFPPVLNPAFLWHTPPGVLFSQRFIFFLNFFSPQPSPTLSALQAPPLFSDSVRRAPEEVGLLLNSPSLSFILF